MDLLDSEATHALRPYSSHPLPSPAYATAVYPEFSLSSPAKALFLASPAFLPIRLLSPFYPNLVASYPLANRLTEAYAAPHSLLFDAYAGNGSHFFAGSDSQISVFDLTRNGEGPLSEMKTIPSRRKKAVGGGVGMKGIVSALSMSCQGVLAAGTFTRWIGFYDERGRGENMGVFELGKNDGDEQGVGEGRGLTQVLWTECGQYLCAVERRSDGISVWDIRGTGKRLAWLTGRNARTMQRLGTQIMGTDIWAGGTDGKVRLWKDIGQKEGVVGPDWDFMAHDGKSNDSGGSRLNINDCLDCVSSAALHHCGTVLATCSGQRHESTYWDSASESDSEETRTSTVMSLHTGQKIDNSLKIWAL